jgi:hypothetical protein
MYVEPVYMKKALLSRLFGYMGLFVSQRLYRAFSCSANGWNEAKEYSNAGRRADTQSRSLQGNQCRKTGIMLHE